jgi:hypothetical protein
MVGLYHVRDQRAVGLADCQQARRMGGQNAGGAAWVTATRSTTRFRRREVVPWLGQGPPTLSTVGDRCRGAAKLVLLVVAGRPR